MYNVANLKSSIAEPKKRRKKTHTDDEGRTTNNKPRKKCAHTILYIFFSCSFLFVSKFHIHNTFMDLLYTINKATEKKNFKKEFKKITHFSGFYTHLCFCFTLTLLCYALLCCVLWFTQFTQCVYVV